MLHYSLKSMYNMVFTFSLQRQHIFERILSLRYHLNIWLPLFNDFWPMFEKLVACGTSWIKYNQLATPSLPNIEVPTYQTLNLFA